MSIAAKPDKPSPDFPLFPHASGKWAKKIAGKIRYFGRWDDPHGALAEYEELLKASTKKNSASQVPIVLTVDRGITLFLRSKLQASSTGEISERTYLEYQRTCSRFANFVGKETPIHRLGPSEFARFKADGRRP